MSFNSIFPKKLQYSYMKVICISIIFLLIAPIIAIIFSSLENTLSLWSHLINTRLVIYLYNTFILMIGVCLTTFLIGVSLAWLIYRYDFFMKNIIEWALLLPFALPSYIVAYCYTDFLEYSGYIQTTLRGIFNFNSPSEYFFPEIRSLGGAIFVISFVLYPYVYLITKLAFRSTPTSLLELAEINGKNPIYSVVLPLARPAIIAGLSLVLMETISDFGTVDFFAVETITLGIFNLWLGMNNLAAASQLALIGFTFVLVLLGLELAARRRQRFNDTKISLYKGFNKKVTPLKSFLIFLICLMPLTIGFVIPTLILIVNSISHLDFENFNNLLNLSINSFFIAIVTSLVIVFLSLILVIGLKFYNFKGMSFLSTAAGIGYAFPGIIIALGTLFFISFFQNTTNSIFSSFGLNTEVVLIGSFFILIFAYVCRFNAVAFGAINSGIS